jgi:antitoxin MazE
MLKRGGQHGNVSAFQKHRRLSMQATIKKWGNSAAVRIPAAMMDAVGLNLDEVVEIREKSGRIVIEPMQKNRLAVLISGMAPKNIHREENFGSTVDKEAF